MTQTIRSQQELQARYGSLKWDIKDAVTLTANTEQQLKLAKDTSAISFNCDQDLLFEFKVFKDGKATDTVTSSTPALVLSDVPERFFQIPDLEMENDEYIYWCVETTANATLKYREH